MADLFDTDLIEGAQLTETSDGIETTRIFLVTNLVDANPESKLFEALQTGGLPQFREAHPSIPNLFVSNRSVESEAGSATQFRVTVLYKHLGGEEGIAEDITIGSTVRNTKTALDVNGAQITVSFLGEDEVLKTEPAEVSIQTPQMILTFIRKENSAPFEKAKRFVGTINSTPIFEDSARIWLCTRLEGISNDAGSTFRVSYEFQRNEQTWDATVVFIDPVIKRPPVGVVIGNGIETKQVYRTEDFSVLGLTF